MRNFDSFFPAAFLTACVLALVVMTFHDLLG
jgi:hypothetical protein